MLDNIGHSDRTEKRGGARRSKTSVVKLSKHSQKMKTIEEALSQHEKAGMHVQGRNQDLVNDVVYQLNHDIYNNGLKNNTLTNPVSDSNTWVKSPDDENLALFQTGHLASQVYQGGSNNSKSYLEENTPAERDNSDYYPGQHHMHRKGVGTEVNTHDFTSSARDRGERH